MKYSMILSCMLICISCIQKEPLHIDLESEVYIPEHYVVAKAESPVIIDGLAHDLAWQKVSFSNPFIDIEGIEIPKYKTQIKMLWDKKYLYVLAKMDEPHIWGNLKQRDTIIYYNNDFEVFLDPSGTTYNYGEIEVNALNTVWDLKLDRPYRVSGNADNSWNLDELQTAVSYKGTLNNPSDIDTSWTVEMAIPLKPIMQLKGSNLKFPTKGEQWRVNFSRVQWNHDIVNGRYDRKKENDKYFPEHNWVWSKQGVINMHEPEKWGYIQFSDNTIVEKSEFIPEEDLHIKLATYALFRHVRFGSLKNLLSKQEGYIESIQAKISEQETPKAIFTKTDKGFDISVHQPKNKKVYSINQEGWLEIH